MTTREESFVSGVLARYNLCAQAFAPATNFLASLVTKPKIISLQETYYQLKQTVENHVASFLARHKFHDGLQKNSLRNELRNHISRYIYYTAAMYIIASYIVYY